MCHCKNIDFKKLDTSAQEELAAKMKLEDRYRPELTRLFNRVVKDFEAVVAATGQAPDASNFRQDFATSFDGQYRRTQAFFTGRLVNNVEGKIIMLKQSEEEFSTLEKLIAASLVAWRFTSSRVQSMFVTNTNQIQMQESLARARLLQSEAGVVQNNRTLAKTAGGFLRRLFKSRVERNIVTQTQSAAEATRNIEATALAGGVPFPLERVEGVEPAAPQRRVTKSWRDIGDSKVRDSHVIADQGPPIAEDEIFIVGPTRSRLRFPGDMSLGAAVEETINCRCFADYTLIRAA
jgi:hypothetical protein